MTITDVDICNRALSLFAGRDTITALNDGSNEANKCNMIYASVRDQVLSMAPWNFCRKMAALDLIKCAPGVPGSLITNAAEWLPTYPPPPWAYEYFVPSDSSFIRYIISQPFNYTGIPIFSSTPQFTYDSMLGSPPQRFVKATDSVPEYAVITNISQANPADVTAANTFSNGDIVVIRSVLGMREINDSAYTVAGRTTGDFDLSGVDSSLYTQYNSNGVAINTDPAEATTGGQHNVLLTNAPLAIACYTQKITNLDLWEDQAIQAFVSAMAGFLVIAISGDKEMSKLMIGEANRAIMAARTTDANEGYTIQETIPSWIAARGAYPFPFVSTDLPFLAPYPALFTVS